MNLRVLIAILLVLVAGAAWFMLPDTGPDYTITNENPTGENVIALGDSLTAGIGAPPGSGYVGYLEQFANVEIINAGVSGDTTRGALARLQRDVLDRNPKIVLVALGGNDVLRKIPEDETFGNLRLIITQTQQAGALVILIGFDFPLKSSYERRYAELAEELGCPFVPDVMDDVFNNRELMADSVHPNARGYRVMAERIAPVLRKYAETQPTTGQR